MHGTGLVHRSWKRSECVTVLAATSSFDGGKEFSPCFLAFFTVHASVYAANPLRNPLWIAASMVLSGWAFGTIFHLHRS